MYSYDRTGTSKTAVLTDGPVGRVLQKWWNEIHDLESDLEKTIHEYDSASTYAGGPAEKEAKAMVKQLQAAIKELQKLADSGGTFDDLAKNEAKFVAKFGDPDAYVQQQRARMFPR